MNYQSKNNSSAAWLIPIVLLVFDFLVMGGDIEMMKYIIWPTIIGGGFGAFIFWAGNKDISVSITNGKLILKKSTTEFKEYNKEDIISYKISKDQGKAVIRIQSSDKSEYELASYTLDLSGFEEAINNFLKS